MNKVVYLRSAHSRCDVSIFVQMYSSLTKKGYTVSIVVADGKGDEVKNHVNILDVGIQTGRLNRILIVIKEVYYKALSLYGGIYHLHDLELMPIGFNLKEKGKKVIFDAHEELPNQILSKPYLRSVARVALSKLYAVYKKRVCCKYEAVVTEALSIERKLLKVNSNTVNVNNFLVLNEASQDKSLSPKNSPNVLYIDDISENRGIKQLAKFSGYCENINLSLAGRFFSSQLENELKNISELKLLTYYGFVGRTEIANLLSSAKVGMVTLFRTVIYQENIIC